MHDHMHLKAMCGSCRQGWNIYFRARALFRNHQKPQLLQTKEALYMLHTLHKLKSPKYSYSMSHHTVKGRMVLYCTLLNIQIIVATTRTEEGILLCVSDRCRHHLHPSFLKIVPFL